MKYQIYLNKATSEVIEAMAKEESTTPAHMIKVLVEELIDNYNKSIVDLMGQLIEETTTNETGTKNTTTKH